MISRSRVWIIAVNTHGSSGKALFVHRSMQRMLTGQYDGKEPISLVCFKTADSRNNSLRAGSSVENGARSTYKGLVTSQERKSLQRSHSFFSILRSESERKLLIGQFL